MQQITSTANPRVKQIVRLQTQARRRRKAAQFCVETHRELGRALEAGFEMIELYVLDAATDCERWIDHAEQTDAARFAVNASVLDKITYRQNPQGLVAVMSAPPRTLNNLEAEGAIGDTWVVCSGLEKPGNLGAILRTASGAGVSGVLIDDPACDLFNPNCVRTSTGAVFSVPIACAAPEDLIEWLSQRAIRVVALSPEAETAFDAFDWSGSTAIALGAEAEGLADTWRDAAQSAVSIPMRGRADSLNVSVAAALVMFEAVSGRK